MKDNKLPPDEKIDGIMQRITTLTGELYKIMEHGLTIEVMFPQPTNIIVPNKKPIEGKLIITKPAMNVHIQVR